MILPISKTLSMFFLELKLEFYLYPKEPEYRDAARMHCQKSSKLLILAVLNLTQFINLQKSFIASDFKSNLLVISFLH